MTSPSYDELYQSFESAMYATDVPALERLLELCEQDSSMEYSALALRIKATIARFESRLNDASDFLSRALDAMFTMTERREYGDVLLDLTYLHLTAEEYPTAVMYANRAYETYMVLGAERSACQAAHMLGILYSFVALFPDALRWTYRALDGYEQIGDETAVALCLHSIGVIYSELDEHALALDYGERALDILERLGQTADAFSVKESIAVSHAKSSEYDVAIAMLEQVISYGRDNRARLSYFMSIANLVDVLQLAQRFDEAKPWIDQLEAIEISHKSGLISRLIIRAKDLEHDGDLETSTKLLNEALVLADENNKIRKIIELRGLLRDLSQRRNDLASYIEHNNEYLRLNEEFKGREVMQKVAIQDSERKINAERAEHQKQMALLHAIMPEHIAARVANGERILDQHELASVIFCDIVGFTALSESLPSLEVASMLESLFRRFDEICKSHGVQKIKTIGDSYMAVAFEEPIAQRSADAAIDFLRSATEQNIPVRIGVHCGPVTAGVIGTDRPQYDVWGDTVNVASRMEQASEPQRIQVSQQFANTLNTPPTLQLRGTVDIKGKGLMQTYWLDAQPISSNGS